MAERSKPSRSDRGEDVPNESRRDGAGESEGSGDGGGSGPRGSGSSEKGPGGPRQPNLMSRGVLGWVMLIALAVVLLVLMNNAQRLGEKITADEMVQFAADKHFEGSIVLKEQRMSGTLKPDTPGIEPSPTGKGVYAPILPSATVYWLDQLRQVGHQPQEEPGGGILVPLLISWGPILLIALLIYFFVFRSLRNAGGGPGMLGSFGRSRHKLLTKEHSNITIDDVAGIDEAKEEVGELIEFLKNPKKFQRLGGRVPRGVLLIGAPGCGKTLLAKAVAGEADVPFFSISGSDFVEMFVGVGASRVRDLFKQAKDAAPCIIFLDEIDAVGRRRGSGFSSGGHDEREQTLNAILVEIDGFDSTDQVIVMAATNRSDVLDPALTRPGRFDRSIHVPLPDIKGRMEILKVHSRKVKLGPDVDLKKTARGTPMFSGADLAAIINEAAITATLLGKDFVEQEDLEEARDKVRWGRARKSHKIEEDEKKIIAYHEAGHALVLYFDDDSEPLHKVTIIPRGEGLGAAFMLPEKDRHIYTKKQLLAQLRVTFGGRIGEELFCDDISSGAAMDIRQATAIARAMISEYGMSERLGFQLFGLDEGRQPWEQPDKLYSEETSRQIDEEVTSLIDQAYGQTRQLLEQHRDQLDAVAKALLKYETLTREEVDKITRGEPLPKATVSDLLESERQKAPTEPARPPTTESPPINEGDAPSAMPSPA